MKVTITGGRGNRCRDGLSDVGKPGGLGPAAGLSTVPEQCPIRPCEKTESFLDDRIAASSAHTLRRIRPTGWLWCVMHRHMMHSRPHPDFDRFTGSTLTFSGKVFLREWGTGHGHCHRRFPGLVRYDGYRPIGWRWNNFDLGHPEAVPCSPSGRKGLRPIKIPY